VLKAGVPDEAFKRLTGADPSVWSELPNATRLASALNSRRSHPWTLPTIYHDAWYVAPSAAKLAEFLDFWALKCDFNRARRRRVVQSATPSLTTIRG
jgi:hypothetical protein